MMAGNYRMTRGWMDHSMFGGDPYCRRAAWTWLIEHAAFAPHTVRIGAKDVELNRGQLVASVRHLATEWGWKPTRVQRFIKRLEGCNATATASATVGATAPRLITICNYDKYQASPTNSETANATPTDSQPQQEIKKEKKVPYGEAPQSGAAVNPDKVLFDQCLSYLTAHAVKEKHARSLIGGWRKEYGAGAVIEIVSEASRQEVSEPIGWIVKALKKRHGPPEYREPAPL